MKRWRLLKGLALLAISAIFLAGMLGARPHIHPDVGGQEQEECTPCFLHRAVQPLAGSGLPLIFQTFLVDPLILPVDLPVFSRSTPGSLHSRSPPGF